MYVYFPIPSIKKDSSKLGHFLSIVDFYKQLKRIEQPRVFEVEPKLGGKGLPEPDAFCIWKGAPWYIEIQRSVYTEKQMNEKLNRYENYYLSGEWEKAEWQPAKKMFPYVWVIGAGKYEVGVRSFKVIQANVEEIVRRFGK